MEPVTHVIFDMDGLLINTEDLYTKALSTFCRKYGKEFTMEIKMKQMGRKTEESARVLIDALNLPCTIEEYKRDLRAYQRECFSEAELLPGAEKLVRHLHAKGIAIAIATGSDQESYDIKTARHQEFIGLFHHVVLSGTHPEVKNGKPAPDVFLVAAKEFDQPAQPKNCLVFEDAPLGLEAAVAAKMRCVLVPSLPENLLDQAVLAKATLKLNSLEQFVPEQFGLPAYS